MTGRGCPTRRAAYGTTIDAKANAVRTAGIVYRAAGRSRWGRNIGSRPFSGSRNTVRRSSASPVGEQLVA
jgi:hypothetical protein